MSDVLKDRFKDEVVTISGYVDYIENNFYRRSCQVLRTQGFIVAQLSRQKSKIFIMN